MTALDDSGVRLAEAAAQAGLDAPVPTCPGWTVQDLLDHTGGVHRWATAYVATGKTEPFTDEEKAEFFSAPAGETLIDWFRDGHAALVRTLREADPALECWAFLRAPSLWRSGPGGRRTRPRSTGWTPSPPPGRSPRSIPSWPPTASTSSSTASSPGRGGGWSPTRRSAWPSVPPTSRPPGRSGWSRRADHRPGVRDDADCVVSGPATGLYLLLWNRVDADGLDVHGDRDVLALWREKARVVWG
nr:hypothetical protein GCM10020093_053880 [Planobispora longispora]